MGKERRHRVRERSEVRHKKNIFMVKANFKNKTIIITLNISNAYI
jgi:hypothetical protein